MVTRQRNYSRQEVPCFAQKIWNAKILWVERPVSRFANLKLTRPPRNPARAGRVAEANLAGSMKKRSLLVKSKLGIVIQRIARFARTRKRRVLNLKTSCAPYKNYFVVSSYVPRGGMYGQELKMLIDSILIDPLDIKFQSIVFFSESGDLE